MSQGRVPIRVRTIRIEAIPSSTDEVELRATLVDERPGGSPPWFGAEPPP
jgi:hypothetical protein